MPFELPNNWIWVSIGDISFAKGGKRIPKGYSLQDEENEHPYLRVTEMKNGTIIDSKIKYVPESVYELIKNYTISSDDIYITIAGTIGEVGTIPEKYNNSLLTENALKLVLPESINKNFLIYAIQSSVVKSQFNEIFNQVAQPKLSIKSTNSTLIPLPPLKEQGRIVEQNESALKKVDEYAESYHKLEKLNTEFPEKLKKSFLQYAMEGKLVEQDLNDEPASELLKRIKSEKEKLVLEGKIKKDKKESYIVKDKYGKYYEKINNKVVQEIEVPFEIPESWEWARLDSIIVLISGRDLKLSEYGDNIKNGIPYLTGASDFKNGKLDTTRYTSKPVVISYEGDLLITVKGTIGEIAFNTYKKSHIARQIMAIRAPWFNLKFIKYYIKTVVPRLKSQAQSMIPGISRVTLLDSLIPIPPLEEQKRIVDQIEIVLKKVDEYSESIIVSKKS
ncbi:hypothetical protein BI362_11210 [Streptococcus parauberis]|nr:hypothetical protein BI362_11210 [Streptococcus parauberis]